MTNSALTSHGSRLCLCNKKRAEVIALAISVLEEMGLASETEGFTVAVLRTFSQTNRLLRKHTNETLSNLPILKDEKRIIGYRIMDNFSTSTAPTKR